MHSAPHTHLRTRKYGTQLSNLLGTAVVCVSDFVREALAAGDKKVEYNLERVSTAHAYTHADKHMRTHKHTCIAQDRKLDKPKSTLALTLLPVSGMHTFRHMTRG